MIDLEYEFEGLDDLKRAVDMMPDIALNAAEPAMTDMMLFLHGQIKEYPEKDPESRYQRAGKLGKEFFEKTVIKNENEVIGSLGTATPYAPWVVGPDWPGEMIGGRKKYQASFHAPRWWQFYDVVEENMEAAWIEFNNRFLPEFVRQFTEVANA